MTKLSVNAQEFKNQQHLIPLPKQVWRHYRGGEVLIEAIEYSRNAIGEGAIVEMRGLDVKAAGEVPKDFVLVLYSHSGKYWVRTMHEFLEILGDGGSNFNRYTLVHDPRTRRKDAGFTLIEALVVIAIMGLLAALVYPSILDQINKAREAEAKTYIGSVNRAQQVSLIEQQRFGTLVQLGNPIPTETASYEYSVTVSDTEAIVVATPTGTANPTSGIVVLQNNNGQITTQAAICPRTLTPAIGCAQ